MLLFSVCSYFVEHVANCVKFFFQKVVITPIKKDLGLAFKGNQKMVVEALEVIVKEAIHIALDSDCNWML